MKSKVVTKIILILSFASILTAAFKEAYTTNETPVHNINTGLHYETIHNAIDAPQTLEGHTIQVDAGIYFEHVIMDKSLNLVGEDSSTTIIDAGGSGTVIEVRASSVNISGFTLRNSGPDFDDKGISLDHSSNTKINGNIIKDSTWGIWLESAANNILSENAIQNSTSSAIYLGDSTNNSISRNTITDNKYGIWLERSDNNAISGNAIVENGMGISLANDSNNNTVSRNTVEDNDEGIHLFSSSNSIHENTLASNWYGIFSLHSGGNIIYRNNFIGNIVQAHLNESYVDIWDNGAEGNYWSDYTGDDQNGDGVGDTDTPHHGLDRYPLMEVWSRFRMFDVTLEGRTYHVATLSNSTMANFNFNRSLRQISFSVTGPSNTEGFCNVTIPKSLLRGFWSVFVDMANVTADTVIVKNDTHTFLYLTYGFTTHMVRIIASEALDTIPLVASFTATPETALVGEVVAFDASASTPDSGSIVNYTWDFGDGTNTTGILVVVNHTYTQTGIFNVTLTVKDAANNSDTYAITVTILSYFQALRWWITGVLVLVGIAVVSILFWTQKTRTTRRKEHIHPRE